MASDDHIIIGLLVFGVAAQLACTFGLTLIRDSLSRLHYVGAGLIMGVLPIAAAILLDQGLSVSGVKAAVTVLILLLTGPVVTQATGHAIYRRMSRREHRQGL